jgi:hypothetical protein
MLKSPRSSPSRKRTYTIIDNGGKPFVVDVHGSKVEIYRQKYDNQEEKWKRVKKVAEIPFIKIFIGDNKLNSEHYAEKGKFSGNSILLNIDKGKYVYIGDKIYTFDTHNHEKITKYYSPVGNSQVPYPYAVGEKNTYFMLDKQSLPNTLLDLKKDAYGQFYDIDASKQKMKTKQIHKRAI